MERRGFSGEPCECPAPVSSPTWWIRDSDPGILSASGLCDIMPLRGAQGPIRKLIQPGDPASPLWVLVSGLPPRGCTASPESSGVLGPCL